MEEKETLLKWLVEEKDNVDFAFMLLKNIAHATAKSKGFYKPINDLSNHPVADPYIVSTQLMNAVSELAEANEWLRKGNPPSDHVPDISGAEEEIADCIIRLMDLCEYKRWNIGAAIIRKMIYNLDRTAMNGGKVY